MLKKGDNEQKERDSTRKAVTRNRERMIDVRKHGSCQTVILVRPVVFSPVGLLAVVLVVVLVVLFVLTYFSI